MSCDVGWLEKLPSPAAEETPLVVTTAVEGRVGARVALRSSRSPAEWSVVLHQAHVADDWLPPALGVGRAELLEPGVLYQALDVPLFGGVFHFRRQTVVTVTWLEDGDRVRTCWTAVDPAPWKDRIAAWDTGAPWAPPGKSMGGWEVTPQPGGGSRASYQLWGDDATVLPGVQEWAMSRTLPEMILAYAGRVELISAAPGTP